jgi:predicted Rossmann-fold nucleotide-binding protein
MSAGPPVGSGQQQQDEMPRVAVPVIAVFGGAKDDLTRDAAEQIGYEIGLSRAILLTGGDDPRAQDLKGRALAGACRARNCGAMAPWIGVVREQPRRDPRFVDDGLGLVLQPGGNHYRNYAEAEFCNAAIAFKGEEGTSSEVLFCLALGKPLILIGDSWPSQYPMVSGAHAREALKAKALELIPQRPEHPCLGPPITKAYELFDQVVEPFFKHFALPPETPPRAVVEEAILVGKTSGGSVETPCLNPEHEAIRQFRASLRNRGFQNEA